MASIAYYDELTAKDMDTIKEILNIARRVANSVDSSTAAFEPDASATREVWTLTFVAQTAVSLCPSRRLWVPLVFSLTNSGRAQRSCATCTFNLPLAPHSLVCFLC